LGQSRAKIFLIFKFSLFLKFISLLPKDQLAFDILVRQEKRTDSNELQGLIRILLNILKIL
jgi:hypothetical protein